MYSTVCPNCGEKSDQNVEQCSSCGFIKEEILKTGIFNIINDALVEYLSFLDYPQLYATILIRGIILVFVIFLIPDFISKSEFFWMLVGIFSVYGLVKEVARSYSNFFIVYKISKGILFFYFGAGISNLILHTGKMNYFKFSYYFNLEFIYQQLQNGNKLIILGAIAGLFLMLLIDKIMDEV